MALTANTSGYMSGLAKASGATKAFGSQTDRTARATEGRWVGLGSKITKVFGGLAIGAAAGAVALGAWAVSVTTQFDKRLSAVKAVSGATTSEMERVRQKALDLGAASSFSASESAVAIEELVKAGIPLADVMSSAADATVDLAAAGEVDLKRAAEIAANAMNAFDISAKEMPRIADIIAGAANASAIDVEQFGLSLAQVSAIADTVGFSFEDTATAIGLLGNAGIVGSDAGTSLKTMFMRLTPATDKQSDAMKALGIITEDGSNRFFDAQGNVKSMSEVAGVLSSSMKGLTREQQLQALATIFGSDAVRAAAVFAKEGSVGFDQLATSINKVTAEQVAEERLNNLAGDLERLKGSAETLAIVVGSALSPMLRDLAQAAEGAVNWLADPPDSSWLINLADYIARFRPAFDDLVDAGGNVLHLFGEVVDAVLPVVEVLGMIGGAVVLGAISGLAQALSTVTGFLAEHETIVKAVAAAYLAWKAVTTVTSILETVQIKAMYAQDALVKLGRTKIGSALVGSAQDMGAALGSFRTDATRSATHAKSAFSKLGSVFASPAVGLTLVTIAVGSAISAWKDGEKAADKFMDAVNQKLKTNNLDSYNTGLKDAKARLQELKEQVDRDKGDWSQAFGGWADLLIPFHDVKNSLADARAEGGKMIPQVTELAEKTRNFADNISQVAGFLGISETTADVFVKTLDGVDLTGAVAGSAEQRAVIYDAWDEFSNSALIYGANVKDIGTVTEDEITKMKEVSEAASKAMTDTAEAFSGAFDILARADPSVSLRGTYKMMVQQATDFTGDLTKAIEAGYDPNLISRIMLAGPEDGAAVLSQLVKNTSAGHVQMVNDAEQTLAGLSGQVVEQMRLTQIAVNSKSDQVTKGYAAAQKITQAQIVLGYQATTAQIAEQTGLTRVEIERVATDYGITLNMDATQVTTGLGDISAKFAEYVNSDPEAVAALNTADPNEKLRLVEGLFQAYARSHPEAQAWLDTTDADTGGAALRAWAESWASTNPTATAWVDIQDATAGLDEVTRKGLEWAASDPRARAFLDRYAATGDFGFLQTAIEVYNASNPTTAADIDPELANVAHWMLMGKADEYERRNPTATADLITAPVDMSHDAILRKAGEWDRRNPTTSAHLLTKPTDDSHAAILRKAGEWQGRNPTTSSHLITDPATSSFRYMGEKAEWWTRRNPSTQSHLDPGPTTRSLNYMGDKATWWDRRNPGTTAHLDWRPVEWAHGQVVKSARDITAQRPFFKILADGSDARNELESVRRKAAEVPWVGGVLSRVLGSGSMKFNAQGNVYEQHTAEIAPGGAMRVWAEPETGGEAYIPLAQAKRSRSTAILSEVASRFGLTLQKYAAGGVTTAEGPVDVNWISRMYRQGMDVGYAAAVKRRDAEYKWNMATAANAAAMAGAAGGGGSSMAGAYTPLMKVFWSTMLSKFGPMDVQGYAPRNIAGTSTPSAHARWRALDFMVGGNRGKGQAIADFALGSAGSYGVKGVIFYDRSNYGGRGWKPYRHPGGVYNATTQHRDHPHVEFYKDGGIAGWPEIAPGWPAPQDRDGKPMLDAAIPRPGGRDDDVRPDAIGMANGGLYEDERGFNWRTMGNRRAGPAIMSAFPNGLLGDLNQSGRISNKEWWDWTVFQNQMRRDPVNTLKFLRGAGRADGGVTLHQNTFDQGGVLRDGWNLLRNATGRDEYVAPVTPPARGIVNNVTIHVHGTVIGVDHLHREIDAGAERVVGRLADTIRRR